MNFSTRKLVLQQATYNFMQSLKRLSPFYSYPLISSSSLIIYSFPWEGKELQAAGSSALQELIYTGVN